MEKKRKIPERQCLGCNEHKPKAELIRVVRSPDGTVSLDFGGRANGRGAYICQRLSCLKKVRKSGRLEKNLGVSIPAEVYDEMEKELMDHD